MFVVGIVLVEGRDESWWCGVWRVGILVWYMVWCVVSYEVVRGEW